MKHKYITRLLGRLVVNTARFSLFITITSLIGCTPMVVPTPEATRLEVFPQAQLFTQNGETHKLVVSAFDATGNAVNIPADQLEWVNSNESKVRLETQGIEANAVAGEIGTTEVFARLKANPQIRSSSVFLSHVTLAPGVLLFDDTQQVFPIPGQTETTNLGDIPEVTNVDGVSQVAGFTPDEIAAMLSVEDNLVRVPVILRRTDFKVDDIIKGSQNSSIAGRVVKSIVRGDRALLQVEAVGPLDVFSEYSVANILKQQKVLSISSKPDRLQPRAIPDCTAQAGLGGFTASADVADLKFVVKANEIDKKHAKFIVGYNGSIGLKASARVQLAVQPKIECTLGASFTTTFPIFPPPLSTFLTFVARYTPKVSFDFGGSAGPEMSIALKPRLDFDGQVVVCAPSCTEESNFKPDPSFSGSDFDGSLIQSARLSAKLKLYLDGPTGILVGGVALSQACSLVKLLVSRAADFCQTIEKGATISFLQSQLGTQAQITWDSAKRVEEDQNSMSTVQAGLFANLELKNDQLSKLSKLLGGSELKVNIFKGELPLITAYRVFKGTTATVTQNSGTHTLTDGQTLDVEEDENLSFQYEAEYTPLVPVTILDTPLSDGVIFIDGTEINKGEYSVVTTGKTARFNLKAKNIFCGKQLTFLGYNRIFSSIPTAGYLRRIILNCGLQIQSFIGGANFDWVNFSDTELLSFPVSTSYYQDKFFDATSESVPALHVDTNTNCLSSEFEIKSKKTFESNSSNSNITSFSSMSINATNNGLKIEEQASNLASTGISSFGGIAFSNRGEYNSDWRKIYPDTVAFTKVTARSKFIFEINSQGDVKYNGYVSPSSNLSGIIDYGAGYIIGVIDCKNGFTSTYHAIFHSPKLSYKNIFGDELEAGEYEIFAVPVLYSYIQSYKSGVMIPMSINIESNLSISVRLL